MKREEYITAEEKKRCRKVADAFLEFYDMTDTIVVDAGRYGFVKLQYYKRSDGFDSMVTYTDSKEMFDDLWQDWFANRLLMLVKGTVLEELEYEEIFRCLPEEKQEEIMKKRCYFKNKSDLNL